MRTVLAKVLHAFHHIEILYFFFLILKFSTTKYNNKQGRL